MTFGERVVLHRVESGLSVPQNSKQDLKFIFSDLILTLLKF